MARKTRPKTMEGRDYPGRVRKGLPFYLYAEKREARLFAVGQKPPAPRLETVVKNFHWW
jgi:hypothetical protein